MLKLVVAAGSRAEERALIATAEAVVTGGEPFTVCALVPHTEIPSLAERLDAVLFDRPLADILVVVGRRCVGRPDDLRFFVEVLRSDRTLAAATGTENTVPSTHDVVQQVVEHGGAFRCGPICQAGGFVADGRTPLGARLEGVGFRATVLPEAFSAPALFPEGWSVPA